MGTGGLWSLGVVGGLTCGFWAVFGGGLADLFLRLCTFGDRAEGEAAPRRERQEERLGQRKMEETLGGVGSSMVA